MERKRLMGSGAWKNGWWRERVCFQYIVYAIPCIYLCAAAAPNPHAITSPLRRHPHLAGTTRPSRRRHPHIPATTRPPRRRLSYHISASDCVNVCVCVCTRVLCTVYTETLLLLVWMSVACLYMSVCVSIWLPNCLCAELVCTCKVCPNLHCKFNCQAMQWPESWGMYTRTKAFYYMYLSV